MLLFHVFILAVVQGISEFLPISSSGHLILTHALLHQGDGPVDYWGENLTLDIAVHVGSLLAVFMYFRRDIAEMIVGFIDVLRTRSLRSPGGRRAILLVAGTAPVMVVGLLLHIYEPAWARSLPVAATSLIVFGLLLGYADSRSPVTRDISTLTLRDVMIVGLAQALSLIPGTSRSGITMTAARFLGFSRVEAARFSFLLGTLAISGAGLVGALDLFSSPQPGQIQAALVGVAVSCIAALGAVHFLMKWLAKASFSVFVWYRVGLGVLLLVLLYTGVL